MPKRFFLLLFLFTVVLIGFIYLPPAEAPAQAGGPLGGKGNSDDWLISGFAWSANVGWLDFGNYGEFTQGVKINKASGAFSGYAWSNNVGWVKFDIDAGNAPQNPKISAKIAIDNNGRIPDGAVAEGWARACGVFKFSCGGALWDDFIRGGWDGWIKMSSLPGRDPFYGVIKGTDSEGNSRLVGFVWAGDLGWISFDGSGKQPGEGDGPNPCDDPDKNINCDGPKIDDEGGEPPFTAICSVDNSYPKKGDQVTWTATASGGQDPYTYCWGNGGTCTLGGDVHGDTRQVTMQLNNEGWYRGNAQITDANGKIGLCSEDVFVTGGGLPHQCSDRIDNDNDGLIDDKDPSCYVGCDLNNQYQPDFDNEAFVCGGGKLEIVPGNGVVRITEQPLGEPAISTTGQVRNAGGDALQACVADVVSRISSKSLAKDKSGGGLLDGSGKEKLPTCWLDVMGDGDDSVPNPFDVKTSCYGQAACVDLSPGEIAQFAIVVQRPLKVVADNHPYDVTIESPGNNSVNLLFEYLVTRFEEK